MVHRHDQSRAQRANNKACNCHARLGRIERNRLLHFTWEGSFKGSNVELRFNPLADGLENIFSGFTNVVVVELNDEGLYGYGQLAAVLRARYCDPRIRAVTKTDGLPWKVKEILQRALTVTK